MSRFISPLTLITNISQQKMLSLMQLTDREGINGGHEAPR
jgi:hypothetical protein